MIENLQIDKLDLDKGQNFLFHYDFGDDWIFTVHVNKIEEVLGRIKTTQVGKKGSWNSIRIGMMKNMNFKEVYRIYPFAGTVGSKEQHT